VYVPNRQRVLVKQSGEFERTHRFARHRVFLEELGARPAEFALLAQTSTVAELARAGCLAGATTAWSMWHGYLDTERGRRVASVLAAAGVPVEMLHASGHASASDLRALANAVAARRVIPIHTAAPGRFADRLERVELRKDGEWWEA
jgi:ribonuclease J